ncbi:MAG: rRNA maturation RNase YbeY [Flavisolibacter sp.]
MSQKISFHYTDQKFSFRRRNLVRSTVERLIRAEGQKVGEIHYIFCSDEYLLQLNQTHLKHDTLTDIITFQYNEPREPIVSDIYISVERVRENATTFAVSFSDELLRVIFHGALHLVGYKDKTSVQKSEMRQMEDRYLQVFKSST